MKHIVVASQGFVFIGDITNDGDDYLRLDNASCIRRWGTTNGLGQIALQGPTSETILDPCGVVEIARAAVVMKILCTYDD